jgi:response regulator NasT
VKPIKSAQLVTAIGIATQRFDEFQAVTSEASNLKQALEDRKIIERAKGILMKQANLDEEHAFKRLQDLASNKHQKMVEIARMILMMRDAFEPKKEERPDAQEARGETRKSQGN